MDTILKRTKAERRTRAGYVIAFILLLSSYLVTLYTNKQLGVQASRVEHTNRIINDLNSILDKLKDAELGVRGYVITKEIRFLFPFYGTEVKADSLHASLRTQLSDNPVQLERLSSLKTNIDRKFTILNFSIQSFNDNNRETSVAMRSMREDAKKSMDDIRSTVAIMEREEARLLTERNARMQWFFQVSNVITVISVLLAVALLVFGFVTFIRESKSKRKALQRIKDYQFQLNGRIDELNKANTELIQMRSQEKFAATGRIARTIAHEVRNPLTNINLATDQLKAELADKDENAAFLFDMINRNSNRINLLISDLLNSTKFSELNYEKMSVNDLIDEAIKDADDRIALNTVDVVKKYDPTLHDISVDKTKLKIALLNIIINALEAMNEREGSVLTLATTSEKNRCLIIISDNGAGMDEEALSRLFEPYFTSKPKGNGLGLTNTQNIILNHKGTITVESKKGKGTTFKISLAFSN